MVKRSREPGTWIKQMDKLIIKTPNAPGLSEIFLSRLSDNSDGDAAAEVCQVGDPSATRGDKLDGDRLGGGVAGEGLPVRH